MSLPLAKALHIVGFISWFAGLLYISRLFIYWVEAKDRPEAEKQVLQAQLSLMAKRLWLAITWPAFIVTMGCGSWLAFLYTAGGAVPDWLWLKFAIVGLTAVYHLHAHTLYRGIRAGRCGWSGEALRHYNELATLLMISAVFVAVFKHLLDTVWALAGLLIVMMAMAVVIRLYRRLRTARNPS